jgi:hypothetical protein
MIKALVYEVLSEEKPKYTRGRSAQDRLDTGEDTTPEDSEHDSKHADVKKRIARHKKQIKDAKSPADKKKAQTLLKRATRELKRLAGGMNEQMTTVADAEDQTMMSDEDFANIERQRMAAAKEKVARKQREFSKRAAASRKKAYDDRPPATVYGYLAKGVLEAADLYKEGKVTKNLIKSLVLEELKKKS